VTGLQSPAYSPAKVATDKESGDAASSIDDGVLEAFFCDRSILSEVFSEAFA